MTSSAQDVISLGAVAIGSAAK